MTKFANQQVLRTKVPLKTTSGQPIRPGTRVVVIHMNAEGRAVCKVMDPTQPTLAKLRLTSSIGAFNATHRGRPRK